MNAQSRVFCRPRSVFVAISLLLILVTSPVTNAAIENQGADLGPGFAVESTLNSVEPRQRPVVPPQALDSSSAPGYCPSDGGYTGYESITSVTLTPNPDGTMKLVVQIYIANPEGCVSGEPCPSYDSSPEYVNVWIDWNGDKTWDSSERVMDKALTGYLAINYQGTMTAISQFSPPSSATSEPTWLRANLGWAYDPNDPCEYYWTWGDVLDQEVVIERPQIEMITVQGVGTTNDNPETGSPVRLEATIDEPTGYEVTKCSWTGDLTPGEGDTANNCRYEYTPATGDGPDTDTYGEKEVTLTITFKHTASGATGLSSKNHAYKVFFEKEGDDDGDCNWWYFWEACKPNWVEYWGDDGAVPAMNDSDVYYNASLSDFGRFTAWNEHVEYGPAAAGSEPPYTIPSGPNCPGASLGGDAGIDEVALTIAHEKRHKEIWSNWQSGGIWVGWTDSDKDEPSAGYYDDLPDDYEINTTHTATDTVDSCDLKIWVHNDYRLYGDNEFQARLAEIGVTGNADRDWANPGKQTDPPFDVIAQAQSSVYGPILSTGPSVPNASYSTYALLTADVVGLTGVYSDIGVDTDSDGLYNELRLSVGVQVTETATYNLVAWIEDSVGTGIAWASTQRALSTGMHTVDLYFDGLTIRGSGLDGPYSVVRVELRTANDELLFDADDDAYTTATYSHTEFESPDVAFAGSFSDAGVDTNADSLYDFLRVTVGLDVEKPEIYTITGELEGSDFIAVASTTAPLLTGEQSVVLDFDGLSIFQHRQDGPYHLKALRVEDPIGNRIDFRYDAYWSSAYSYSQFQNSGTTIDATSYSDQGLDIDSDGDYDYLRIQFHVQAAQDGDYRLLADLKDNEGKIIAGVVQDVGLAVGLNPVSLDFLGSAILEHGVDGPYQLASVALLDSNGAIVDHQQMAHTTQAYSFTNFAPRLVSLAGSYQDSGRDTDGDGQYDYLDIEIGVIPSESGVIVAHGRLVDSFGQTIEWAENYTEMSAGVLQTITISFTGLLILANGMDGPYELRDLLVYHTGDPGQAAYLSQAYTTSNYSYLDFERYECYIPIVLRNSEGG